MKSALLAAACAIQGKRSVWYTSVINTPFTHIINHWTTRTITAKKTYFQKASCKISTLALAVITHWYTAALGSFEWSWSWCLGFLIAESWQRITVQSWLRKGISTHLVIYSISVIVSQCKTFSGTVLLIERVV